MAALEILNALVEANRLLSARMYKLEDEVHALHSDIGRLQITIALQNATLARIESKAFRDELERAVKPQVVVEEPVAAAPTEEDVILLTEADLKESGLTTYGYTKPDDRDVESLMTNMEHYFL